jgi:hypothetical protein
LGIHRHLNELLAREQQPQVDYPEVSFWYLVNHLGRRFLADVTTYLPGLRQEMAGDWPVIWQEILRMVTEQEEIPVDIQGLIAYLKQSNTLIPFLIFAIEAVGVKQFFAALEPRQIWDILSPKQREELLRLAQEGMAPQNDPG